MNVVVSERSAKQCQRKSVSQKHQLLKLHIGEFLTILCCQINELVGNGYGTVRHESNLTPVNIASITLLR